MSRPNHFEIPVDEPDRAEKFYAEVFGWTFQRYDGAPEYYGMTTTGDDGGKVVQEDSHSFHGLVRNLRGQRGQQGRPVQGRFVCGVGKVSVYGPPRT
jgi:catechol 2,3-dioxygenase-like lactoylglutathione lyase family enzyme